MLKNLRVIGIDGTEEGAIDFPVVVCRTQEIEGVKAASGGLVTDPVFTDAVVKNLYGRLMTLVEATTEANKLKPVKDLFSKEIREWSDQVYKDARGFASGENHSGNIYIRASMIE